MNGVNCHASASTTVMRAQIWSPSQSGEKMPMLASTESSRPQRPANIHFRNSAATTGVRNVAEYLAHERRDLVSRPEAEDFYRGVERLREDLDRLEARTRGLEASEEPAGNRR